MTPRDEVLTPQEAGSNAIAAAMGCLAMLRSMCRCGAPLRPDDEVLVTEVIDGLRQFEARQAHALIRRAEAAEANGTGEERSGVCHCGSPMDGHSVYDNHSALEMTRPCELADAGVWRCSSCGDMQEVSDPRWRWNGAEWEHKCGDPQAGHHPARYFGRL